MIKGTVPFVQFGKSLLWCVTAKLNKRIQYYELVVQSLKSNAGSVYRFISQLTESQSQLQ
jgi:hypothetical protein